jgi:hypothetical protein
MYGKPNDPARELVHDDHDPMRVQRKRFTAKEIHAPKTVFAVA